MIYVLVEILNYRQLQKISEDAIEALESGFKEMIGSKRCKSVTEEEGSFLFSLGSEQLTDARSAIDSIFHINGIIDHAGSRLYGYNVFVSILEEGSAETIVKKINESFFSLESDCGIWTTKAEVPFFTSEADFRQVEGFYRLVKSKEKSKTDEVEYRTEWKRQSVINAIIEGIAPQINNEQEPRLLFITGPKGSGKTEGMVSVLEKLIGKKYSRFVPLLYTRFKKKSFHHPFLNSINTALLQDLPKYLTPWQKEVWKDHGWLLSYLKSESGEEKCTDHLFEDFMIEYALYMAGYLDMAKKNLFPGIFVCDDIEKYHTLTLSSLYKLIKDYQKYPNFFPILVSSRPDLPDELNKFAYSRIEIGMMEQGEIKQFSRSLYPGLELPKKIIKQVYDATNSQIPLVYQMFALFEKTGRIKKTNKHYSFILPKEGDIDLPKPHDLVLWYFAKGMAQNDRDILYLASLSAGLFTSGEFKAFLASADFNTRDIEDGMERLATAGLIVVKEYIISAYPSLKEKFEEIMGQRSAYLKESFMAYATNLYASGGKINYVLLFSCFWANGRYETAFGLLTLLIKRKIDERALSGVKPFLSVKGVRLPEGTDSALKAVLRLIQFSGRLRYLYIIEAFERAEKLVERIKKSEKLITASEIRGNMFLTLGKYYLAREETQSSITYVKNALLDFEEFGESASKAEAYFILTSAMLKEGKLDNAVDYLNLSIRLVPEQKHPYEQIQIYALSGITAFMQGNLTKAMFEAERARSIARASGRRSWELFLTFLVSRINFEYGLYAEAISSLQDCLGLITIYSMKIAQPVVYAWLARNFMYAGDSKTGFRLIHELNQTDEVLLFLAEAYCMASEKERALEVIRMINGTNSHGKPHSHETIAWENGYASIEGKCSKVGDKGSVFSMLIRAYKGYLGCINGMTKDGIGELYNITRVEKPSSADPYTHFYYYLYSLTLQEIKDHEGYDSLTILNKALKQLQERASRIENPYDRTRYLNNNYWNSQILDAAKKKNLL